MRGPCNRRFGKKAKIGLRQGQANRLDLRPGGWTEEPARPAAASCAPQEERVRVKTVRRWPRGALLVGPLPARVVLRPGLRKRFPASQRGKLVAQQAFLRCGVELPGVAMARVGGVHDGPGSEAVADSGHRPDAARFEPGRVLHEAVVERVQGQPCAVTGTRVPTSIRDAPGPVSTWRRVASSPLSRAFDLDGG